MNNQDNMLADALIGAAAGALAVWALDRVDWFNFRHEDPEARRRTQDVRPGGQPPAQVAASKTAEALGTDLSPEGVETAGKAIHYAIGIVPGALYGILRRKMPWLGKGRGALFGAGMFLMQDEGMNAVTGLSAKPQDYPWQAHARGLVAHVVYGLVLDAVVRKVTEERRTR